MRVYVQKRKLTTGEDIEELVFYQGNGPTKDKYLGFANCEFPIKYPLVLDNGTVINENDYYREVKGDSFEIFNKGEKITVWIE